MMDRIDPKRLKQLRHSRGVSRRALGKMTGVSVRQLQRIEASDDVRPVQQDTMRKLADWFGVAASVLSGEASITPRELRPADFPQVDADCLRAVRMAKGISRARLEEVSGVSERQIARLESSRTRVQPSTLDALAGALEIDACILTGRGRRGERSDRSAVANGGQAPQLQLAFDLIQDRYGPTKEEVVELAPLMFVLLAEGSLAWRRERLAEAAAALGEMDRLVRHHQLYFLKYVGLVEDGYQQELKSIGEKDLLGSVMREDDHWQGSGFLEDDLAAVTPFADYLRHLAQGLEGDVDFVMDDADGDAVVGSEDPICWGAEPYQVCRERLRELVGESKHARWALAEGDVRVPELPAGLLDPDATEPRIRWLEDRLSDETREQCEEYEQWITSIVGELNIRLKAEGPPHGTASGNDADAES